MVSHPVAPSLEPANPSPPPHTDTELRVDIMTMSVFETPQVLTADVVRGPHRISVYSDDRDIPTQIVLFRNDINSITAFRGDRGDLTCADCFIVGWREDESVGVRLAFSLNDLSIFVHMLHLLPMRPTVGIVFKGDTSLEDPGGVCVSNHAAMESRVHNHLRNHGISFRPESNDTWSYTVLGVKC